MSTIATNLALCPRDGITGFGGSATSVTDSDSVTSAGKMRILTMAAAATSAFIIGQTSTGQVTGASKFGWPASPGVAYSWQYRVKVTTMGGTGTSLQARLYFYDSSGTQLSFATGTTQASPVLNTVYAQSGTATAPANTAWIVIRPTLVLTGATGNAVIRVDAVMFEQSSTVHAYVDGSLANCSWSGTVDASTSSRVTASAGMAGSGSVAPAATSSTSGAGRCRRRGTGTAAATVGTTGAGRARRRGRGTVTAACATSGAGRHRARGTGATQATSAALGAGRARRRGTGLVQAVSATFGHGDVTHPIPPTETQPATLTLGDSPVIGGVPLASRTTTATGATSSVGSTGSTTSETTRVRTGVTHA